jgi:hypothetical protein
LGGSESSEPGRDSGNVPIVGLAWDDAPIGVNHHEGHATPINLSDATAVTARIRVPLVFSTPTLAEKAEIAFQWAASFVPTGRVEATTHRQRAVTVGSAIRYVNRTFLLDAIADHCRAVVARRETIILKAALPNIDVMLGWIAYDTRALHYVYVLESARHTGVASQLLSEISSIGPLPLSCMTSGGAGLLNSISDKWWLPG